MPDFSERNFLNSFYTITPFSLYTVFMRFGGSEKNCTKLKKGCFSSFSYIECDLKMPLYEHFRIFIWKKFHWLISYSVFIFFCAIQKNSHGVENIYLKLFKTCMHLMCICVHGLICNICDPNEQCNMIQIKIIYIKPRLAGSHIH